MQLHFYKYQGTGNDFIIIDNRAGTHTLTTRQIHNLCDRRFGIGADGLMLYETKKGYDFEMKYYNADGKPGSMCGNGARCIVAFARTFHPQQHAFHFLAPDGGHEAVIAENGWINLKMTDVETLQEFRGDAVLDTGSPHYVKNVQDVKHLDVFREGRQIRYSNDFKEKGINVNFVEELVGNNLFVRTYERGVEDETYSCGTGVTAAALVNARNERGFNRVEIETLGGHLAVEFDKTGDDRFENIWLCGPADFVFEGTIAIQQL
jgi:diaminopimelate epimerase